MYSFPGLQRLYRLIRRTRSGIDTVLKCIDTHIRTEGLNDMRNNAENLSTVIYNMHFIKFIN